jgi:hypothetical protein
MFSIVMVIAVVAVVRYVIPQAQGRAGFMAKFAMLLKHADVRVGVANYLAGRSYVVGEFAGRRVTAVLERGLSDDGSPRFFVISMETRALAPLDHSDFEDHATDREGQLALFALKARHDLRLTSIDGCVKARSHPKIFRSFPGRFDPEKWRDVLVQIDALAGSLERASSEGNP